MKSPFNLATSILFRTVLTLAISLAFVTSSYSPLPVVSAYAQVKKPKKRRNLFNMLFGKRGSLNTRIKQRRAKRVKLRRKKIRRKRIVRTAPRIVVVEKSETAAKILVAGDFMAGSLAKGLKEAFANNPEVVIVDISKGLSGFVRDDVKDWPTQISTHIDDIKPITVVFLNGMNDRQQMRLPSGRVSKLSEPWLAAYNIRTQLLAKNIKEKKIPLIWMGLPPVKSGKMSADYLVFNEIYKTQAEAVDGTFVDVWDGFTNAEGLFVSAGPDINGQIKRLRSSDGINMNKTGRRKLAFYAKKAIKKLTGIGTETLLASLPGIEDPRPVTPQYDPAKTGRTVVYSLAGPNLDGGTTLAGGNLPTDTAVAKSSVSYDLVNSGLLPKTHKGRIDHYGVVANEASIALTDYNGTETQKVLAISTKPKVTQ